MLRCRLIHDETCLCLKMTSVTSCMIQFFRVCETFFQELQTSAAMTVKKYGVCGSVRTCTKHIFAPKKLIFSIIYLYCNPELVFLIFMTLTG